MNYSDNNISDSLSENTVETNSGNLQYKDGIFRYLFKEEKNFTDLYLELAGEAISPDKVRFCDTSSLVVNKSLKNDISFITDDNRFIIMVEHQSTINENMALRSLLYYVELLKIYILEKELNVFGRSKIVFPKAELYVAYNGDKPWNQDSLSITAGDVQVTVQIRDIHYESLRHKEAQSTLAGYAFFVKLVKAHQQSGYTLAQAIEKAKHDCLSNGYLTSYLNRKEFFTMMLQVYTIEDQIRDERKEARKEGLEEGREEGRNHMIKAMLDNGKSPEEIADFTGIPLEEIKRIQASINAG